MECTQLSLTRTACSGLWLVVSLVGCASFGSKQIMDESIISQIQPGKTTQAEVKRLLGEPSQVSFSETGSEIWTYMYTESKTRAATFIPVVGAFAGGADTETRTLTIQFKDKGIVRNIGKGHMRGGGGSVFD